MVHTYLHSLSNNTQGECIGSRPELKLLVGIPLLSGQTGSGEVQGPVECLETICSYQIWTMVYKYHWCTNLSIYIYIYIYKNRLVFACLGWDLYIFVIQILKEARVPRFAGQRHLAETRQFVQEETTKAIESVRDDALGQGSLNYIITLNYPWWIVGGFKHCKCMVVLEGFPLNVVPCFDW